MYGFQDSAAVTPNAQGGKLGLNQGIVTKFEYNNMAGAGKTAGDAIDLTVQVGEKEFMKRFFPVGKIYGKEFGTGELTDTNSDEYKSQQKIAVDMLNATLSDIVLTFVDKADLMAALAHPISSFADYAQVLQRLVHSSAGFQSKAVVDVFLEYQSKPSGENTRTFLQLPANVKHGHWICKHQGAGFVEDKAETHLRYTLGEVVHPFKRGEWFVKSSFANVIDLKATTSSASTSSAPATTTQTGTGW